jgi:hypothetical protein
MNEWLIIIIINVKHPNKSQKNKGTISVHEIEILYIFEPIYF